MTKLTDLHIPTSVRLELRKLIKAQPGWDAFCRFWSIKSRAATNWELLYFAERTPLEMHIREMIYEAEHPFHLAADEEDAVGEPAGEPEWRFKDLMVVLGPISKIRDMIRAEGFVPPPEDTVQGWKNRNSVPGKWVPLLIDFGMRLGFIGSIADMRLPRGAVRPLKRRAQTAREAFDDALSASFV